MSAYVAKPVDYWIYSIKLGWGHPAKLGYTGDIEGAIQLCRNKAERYGFTWAMLLDRAGTVLFYVDQAVACRAERREG